MISYHNSSDSYNQINSKVNGLVLSGGLSKRMGMDKGEICYHIKSQRHYLYDLLLSHCNAVFISCNVSQLNYITDLPLIKDAFPEIGPFGGVLSAFQTNSNTTWLTVACDLPFLNIETISYLVSRRNVSKMATAFWDEKGKYPEPLVTIWEPSVFPILLQFYKNQNYSLNQVLINSDIELIHPPHNLALKNVNNQDEYKEAIALLEKCSTNNS